MLSGLPNIADKNFIIGFFLPVVLVLFAAAWAFPDIAVLAPLRTAQDKTLGDLAWQVLAVWTISVALYTTNHLQYRILEGYLPPVAWCFWMRWWQQRRFNRMTRRIGAIAQQWRDAIHDGLPFPTERQDEISKLVLRLFDEFPARSDPDDPYRFVADGLLPTRFGNAIHSFELYANIVYGVDTIPIWLRLASVVPKDFTAEVEDSRAQVNCFMNICYLALALCVFALGRIGYAADWRYMVEPTTGMPTRALVFANLPIGSGYDAEIALCCLVAAWLAYRWATALVGAWGDLVKSAFDCYLAALIKQLGYAVPTQARERQAFWSEFNAQAVYRLPLATAWKLASTDSQATGDGGGAAGSELS
ncbi:MAG TPA: hypothetical protein VMB34_28095 [Acetobacteraceae bacterium]|nr:hypothetical protein [Acetobacteraceae bacterium]